jgi:hypothetical protein
MNTFTRTGTLAVALILAAGAARPATDEYPLSMLDLAAP